MFRAVFDRAIDAILLADDEGRYVHANPAAEKLTGYSAEQLYGMTVFDLTPGPNRDQGQSMWQEFIRQGTLSGDYTLTRCDGSLVEVEFHAVARVAPGTHLSMLRDVTARRRAERRLRRAVSLQEATAAMSAAADTVQVAEVILAAGLAALDAQAGYVVAVFDDAQSAEVLATAGMPPERQERWADAARSLGRPPTVVEGRQRFLLDAGSLLVKTFRSGGPIRVHQRADLEFSGGLPSAWEGLGRAAVCLPLVVRGALVGGLYLFWAEKRSFCEDETAFAATLAGLCGQALDRARLFTAERDAREKAVASEKAVVQYQKRLQSMAFDRVVVEERERRRVATALHDGVTQYLALAKMTLNPVRQRLEGADRAAVDTAMNLVTQAIDETRSLSFELSPHILYDLGLKAALSWLGEKLQASGGLRLEIADDGTEPPLDEVTASIAFRTVRELLINVLKHSSSSTAKVSLHQGAEHLEIVVEDRGAGFDPRELTSHGGFGLMSVREEVGRLGGLVEVRSAPDEGTRILVQIPTLR